MIRKKIDSGLLRQFLISLATNKEFISATAPILECELLGVKYAVQVALWCVSYFKEYGDAPGKALEPMYFAWLEKEKPDDSESEAIKDFLESLSAQASGEVGPVNTKYLLDELGKYLTMKRVQRLSDLLADNIIQGNATDALDAITKFTTIDVGSSTGFNPLKDKAVRARTFADPIVSLMDYGGDAGEFLNPGFTSDTLIGVQGPEKRGKTFWCLEFVYRALRARKKVALFEVGDLSESQVMKRFYIRAAETPMYLSQCTQGILIPNGITVDVDPNGGELAATVSYDPLQTYPAPIGPVLAKRAMKKFHRMYALDPEVDHVMFSVHPMGSINVSGIGMVLNRWRHERGFIPDVIVIDYADILAPEDSRKEFRHQVNETWMALRRLSQERHACVIAPTQASKESYEAKTQKMKHATEDKRKLSHVTAMMGLNQTENEKKNGVMRLNWIFAREFPFDPNRFLWTAQCLALAQPMVESTLYKKGKGTP